MASISDKYPPVMPPDPREAAYRNDVNWKNMYDSANAAQTSFDPTGALNSANYPLQTVMPNNVGASGNGGSVLNSLLNFGAQPFSKSPFSYTGADTGRMPLGSGFYGTTTSQPLSVTGGGNRSGVDPSTWGGAAQNWLQKQGIIGSTDQNGMRTEGFGGLAFAGLNTLGNLYMGMQQYNLAKDVLANNKAQFERNFAAQKTTTNAELEDRQRARVASNAGAYQSVGDYMSRNGIK